MAYLRSLSLSILGSFALVWIWVATMPMAFMESEYASWQAKQHLLEKCDLEGALILGDSRAAADIIPDRLPFRATNLAVGGGTAIEAYAALTRALGCGIVPKQVIISLDPGHFVRPDLFWERSVRFGFIDGEDLATLRATSQATQDWSIYHAHNNTGLPAIARDWLYEIRFPPLYFSSLIHAGGALRWFGNNRAFTTTLKARGHYYFGTQNGSSTVAADGHLTEFRPLPVLDRYFDQILMLLDQHGIDSVFIAMPVNETTWNQVSPLVKSQFVAYLASYERRYPGFHVATDIMPHWPDRFFGDQFCHLNPEGAERLSAGLAQRLQEAPPSTQKDAQNGWFSDTAADAWANVVPISKRGS